MNIVAIIQARMGSTRLPGKVLMDLEGKTVLERVIERVQISKMIDLTVIATTVNPEDLAIVKLCAALGISVYCGSEKDVLDRYYQAARLFNADHVIRITADCPLIDPKIIDAVVELHLKENADDTLNTLKETYPDGLDVEVVRYEALEKAWRESELVSEREHVTPYIKKHPGLFKIINLEYKEDLSAKRWTLDNAEDYRLIGQIYRGLGSGGSHFSMDEILDYLQMNPELEGVNRHIIRNEGYIKSLKEERVVGIRGGK